MIKVINAVNDIAWIFDNGEFKIERWHRYMDQILPEHKNVFVDDMREMIGTGNFTYENDYAPVLNDVMASAGKREAAIVSFQEATQDLEKRITELFGKAPDVNIILYLGLCNGAGWVLELDKKRYIMLGIEKIMELDWCDLNSMYGLIYHELGHVYQMQFGILLGIVMVLINFSGNYSTRVLRWCLNRN